MELENDSCGFGVVSRIVILTFTSIQLGMAYMSLRFERDLNIYCDPINFAERKTQPLISIPMIRFSDTTTHQR